MEALIGLALNELVNAIKSAQENAWRFKKTLLRLEHSVQSLTLIILPILELRNPRKDLFIAFYSQLNTAAELLRQYKTLPKIDVLQRRTIKKLIMEFDEYVQSFLSVELQAIQAEQLTLIYDKMVHMHSKMDQVLQVYDADSKHECIEELFLGSRDGEKPASTSTSLGFEFGFETKKMKLHIKV